MSTLKTGAIRGTSGSADSIQIHATNQSVTFPGNVTCSGTATGFGGGDTNTPGIQVYKSWKIHLAFRWTGITPNQEVDVNNVMKLNLTLAPEEFAELASQIQELSEELADKKHKNYDADFAKAKRDIEDKKKEEEEEARKEKAK